MAYQKISLEKITLNKGDEIAVVIEKVIDSSAEEIVLTIPRFAKVSESIANFQLMKREAEILKKKIIIESVDDQVLEFAGLAKLESFNPLFLDKKKRISDIITERAKQQKIKEEKVKANEAVAHLSQEEEGDGLPRQRLSRTHQSSFSMRLLDFIENFSFKKVFWFGGGIALLAFLVWFLNSVLPKADVAFYVKIIPWKYTGILMVSKDNNLDSENNKLLGQLFTQAKSQDFLFPATGKKHIEAKAQGQLIIFNAYSSETQKLVATTRFIDPTGKIFRLLSPITIPGAKIIDGKIVPSSIATTVEADKAGSDYNIGPTTYFSIPGFKGTAKYAGFYAESRESMSGGYIGDSAYPTANDIKTAKNKVQNDIKTQLIVLLRSQMPADLKILEGSEILKINSLLVSDKVDANNNFKATIEAKLVAIAFKEDDVRQLLLTRMKKELGDAYDFRSYSVSYGNPLVNLANNSMNFSVQADATGAPTLNIAGIKDLIYGKQASEVRSILFSLPNIEKVQISLWPFWVQSMPTRSSRIKIVIN